VQADELRKALLDALDEKLPGRKGRGRSRDELRAAAEAIQYEDWAVDFNMVRCVWLHLLAFYFNEETLDVS
jgi:hypothetical protein